MYVCKAKSKLRMYAGVCGGKVKSVHFFFFSFTTPTQAGLGSLQRFLYLMTSQFKNTVVLEVKSWNYLSAGLIFKHKIGRERRKKNIEEPRFMRVYVQV